MKKIIDISSNTIITDIQALKNYDGIYIKATEGGDWITPKLDELINICESQNIPYGLYHFAGIIHSALEEYQFYKSIITKYTKRLLPDCLDYEQSKEDINFIQQFMSYDNNLIFYSDRDIYNKTGIARNKTWIAIPQIYPKTLDGYFGMQYLQNVNVYGVQNCDISIFDDIILHSNTTISNLKESVKMQAIKQGETSNRVKMIQGFLNVVINAGLQLDGDFGQLTANAVSKYQAIMQIPADSIIGEQTATTILNDIKNSWLQFTDKQITI